MRALSSAQFEDGPGQMFQHHTGPTSTAAYSSLNRDTVGRMTAWQTPRGETPSSYSSKTAGTMLKFDETPKVELPKAGGAPAL